MIQTYQTILMTFFGSGKRLSEKFDNVNLDEIAPVTFNPASNFLTLVMHNE